MRRVSVTPDHIAVLRQLVIVDDNDDQAFIPRINSKRPLGNSKVRDDLAEALGIPSIETDDGEVGYPKGTTEQIQKRLVGLPQALEALLRTTKFETGEYCTATDYDSKWQKVEPAKSSGTKAPT